MLSGCFDTKADCGWSTLHQDTEGSYIEKSVTDSRQFSVLQLKVWVHI